MAIDIYDTLYMLEAVRLLPPEHTFFKSRYFPTNQSLDVFTTSKVLADFKQETLRLAEFTHPDFGPVAVGRDGFATYELEPANISISRPLTLAQLEKRGFGESILSTATRADRARVLLAGDLDELNKRISRTEEKLAIDTMIGNGATIKQRIAATGDDEKDFEDVEVKFFDGDANPAEHKLTSKWTHSTYADGQWKIGGWYHDIASMAKALTRSGSPATEVIVSADVAQFLLEDPWVIAMADNRRIEVTNPINPSELTEFVYELANINFLGKNLRVLVSDGTYVDAKGKDQPYMPDETVIVTAPGCGKGLYGAVTQMDEAGNIQTYTGTRVPMYLFTRKPPVKEVILTTKPLFVPVRPNPWMVANKVLSNPT